MGGNNNPEMAVPLVVEALTVDDAVLELQAQADLLIRTGGTDCLLRITVEGGMVPSDIRSLVRCLGSGARLANMSLTATVTLGKCLDCYEERSLRKVEGSGNTRIEQPLGCSEGSVLYRCEMCGDYGLNHYQTDPGAGSSSEWARIGSQMPAARQSEPEAIALTPEASKANPADANGEQRT